MKIGLSQEEEQGRGGATNKVDTPLNRLPTRRKAPIRRKTDGIVPGRAGDCAPAVSNFEIRRVVCDSRKVQPGALFFALHGAKADGNAFIQDAVKRGAVAIASEQSAPASLPALLPGFRFEGTQGAGDRRGEFLWPPADVLQLVAVTGTNGKTTTTSLIDAIVKASGAKTGLFGTIAYHTPLGDYPAPNTTPESVDLQGFFAEISRRGRKSTRCSKPAHIPWRWIACGVVIFRPRSSPT